MAAKSHSALITECDYLFSVLVIRPFFWYFIDVLSAYAKASADIRTTKYRTVRALVKIWEPAHMAGIRTSKLSARGGSLTRSNAGVA